MFKSKPNKAAQPEESTASGERPPYRAFIVVDAPDNGKAVWVELGGLWSTKDGNGLTGALRRPLPMIAGFSNPRIVVTAELDQA